MKLLLILLLHPSRIIHTRDRVHPFFLNLSVAGYLCMCGMAFQFLYPRLLNNIPWLGALRKLNIANWEPAFNMELFLRGAAMAGMALVSYTLVYWIVSFFVGRSGRGPSRCYLAGLATCMPILTTSSLAFGFYYLDDVLGLVPAYGLVTAACLHGIILKDFCSAPKPLSIYLAPLILSSQAYACFLLLP